jgi:carbon-monoxide dehydrogenase medium subunit
MPTWPPAPTCGRAIPALADLAGVIGDRQVRALGTLGGSVANNDPAACYPAAVLGSGATVQTTQRKIAADDFFQGLFTTALKKAS